jgi:hypothetical protein
MMRSEVGMGLDHWKARVPATEDAQKMPGVFAEGRAEERERGG